MKSSSKHLKVFALELILSSILYASFYFLNLWLTAEISPEKGAHWVFIPAGITLLLSLVLPITGPLGISIAVFAIAYWVRFPGDLISAVGIGVAAGFAPYLARSIVVDKLQIHGDLSNINNKSLALCVFIFSAIRALFHHYWYVFRDLRDPSSYGLAIEFVGNTVGTLIILLIFKLGADLYVNRKS